MNKYITGLLAAISLFASCSKFNNTGPLETPTESYVFDSTDVNGFYAEQFLNDIYASMPTGFNRINGNLLDAATDDAISSQDGTQLDVFTKGFLSTTNNPDDAWAKNYEGIRKANIFLSRIDVVPVPAKIAFWKPEARFLRALFYFELVKRYGGVPLVGDAVLDANKPADFRRASFEDCINYIVTECDSIKGKVKTEPITVATDYGRATTSVVLALKARTLLYAASPLYNGGNIGRAAEQKAVQGYTAYDAERWNKAAQAARDIIALNRFALETSFNNVFTSRKNNEVMLAYLRAITTDLETTNGPVGYSTAGNGNGRTSPTQNLVDAFPMSNGKAITDAASGYNAAAPYTGRDPRLTSTVLVNNAQWLGRPLQTYEGGLDKPNRGTTQTKTGYYLRKFLGDFSAATQYSNQNHNFPIFRYAEVLLNYAEALNEYSGPVADVYTQLRNIRKRAGIAAGTDGNYGLKAGMTKDEMRTAIRTERRLEMAFEEQRFWDVRRWKVAGQVLNTTLNGMQIARNATTGVFTYQVVPVAPIRFDEPKMYFYPVPFSEISKNSSLVQNTGW